MPDRHSLYFSASASKRWFKCTASVLLPRGPEGDTTAADEGTMAHHFTEFTLRDRVAALANGEDPLMRKVRAYKGKMHAHTRLAELHLADLEGYVDFVWALVAAGGRLYIENEVDYSEPLGVDHLHDLERAFGTADALVFMPDGTLWVIDLKFGKYVVDAEGSSQLMFYAVGGARRLRLIHEIKKFRLVIYQPRTKGRPDDQWDCTWQQLARFTSEGYEAAQRILAAKKHYEETGIILPADYGPSPETCEWCRVDKCEARRKSWSRLRAA